MAVSGGVDVEEGAHLTTGLAGGIVAICGLLAGLEATGVRVELRGRVVCLVCCGLSLLASSASRVLLFIREPIVVG